MGKYAPKLPFTQSDTNNIVNAHRYDFNWKTFSTFIKSKGGYEAYVKSWGGVFAKWAERNTTAKVNYKATSIQEFQEAADYVMGIMTAWGFDYNNTRKNPHWGNLSDDAFYTKDFDFKKIQGKDNGANCSIDEIASGKINKAGMCTNCGYGVTYIYRKAGLIPEGAELMEVEFYGDKSWHKYYRNRGATLYKNLSSKEFKVGDVIGFYKDTGFASYNHCCVVVKVDKNAGTYTIFDTGSARFVKTRGCNVVTKIGTSPLYGSYKAYKVMRLPLNLKEVSTVLTMDQFYKKYNGKAIDYDGAYGVQCVDGFRLLCMELGIPGKATPNNWADGYWIYRNDLGFNKYFNYITDYKQLKNGDVTIWKRGSKSHSSSHIALYYNGREFGQNQGGNRAFCLKATDFSDICGALRPKVWATSGSTTPATKPVEKVATGKAKSFNNKLTGTYKVTAKAGLWLRNAAGTNQAKMVLMPLNTKVNCYGYYSSVSGVNWYYVIATVGGVKYTGFCSSQYLTKA